MSRTVADAAKVLEVIAGYDAADPITENAKGKIPENYTQFLLKEGLEGARIGVLRVLSDDKPHPEIKVLFEQALATLDLLGSTVIDPITVPDFEALRQNQWCASFTEDLETFLKEYVKVDSLKSIEDIIRIGSASEFSANRVRRNSANSGRWENPEIPCLDAYND